jgi:prophage antirepressor-like protein
MKMNELKIFENEQFGTIRTVEIDNTPYFVGKDVAEILGYSNTAKAIINHVDEEDKLIFQTSQNGNLETSNRGMYVINESGLYSLILSSKLPEAKEFKRWVTSEVLPAIRKHGVYAVDEVLENPDMLISALQALKEEKAKAKRLTETLAVQEQQIAELQPKASYYDVVLNCKDLVSVTEIAKDYGKSAKWLNEKLHELGIQFKQGGKIWLLYQKYAQKGYTSTKTQTYNGNDGEIHTKEHTYWTQKGRLFIYDKLKAENILPVMEKS